MTKILHLADVHARSDWLEFAVRQSESGDYGLICITGDLLDLNAHRPAGAQVDTVIGYLRRIRTPLAICSGNHDSLAGADPRLAGAGWMQEVRRSHVWIDGGEFDHAGFRFRCLPWGEVTSVAANEKEIWVVHAPPDRSRTGIVRGGADFGDMNLGDLYRSGRGPQLALSGHVHERQSFAERVGRTWVLNPGFSGRGLRPAYNVIDLQRGVAFHYAADGECEAVRLWR
jgi:Icc-related predicted phosphoesterase